MNDQYQKACDQVMEKILTDNGLGTSEFEKLAFVLGKRWALSDANPVMKQAMENLRMICLCHGTFVTPMKVGQGPTGPTKYNGDEVGNLAYETLKALTTIAKEPKNGV